jgi:hypothetical protein
VNSGEAVTFNVDVDGYTVSSTAVTTPASGVTLTALATSAVAADDDYMIKSVTSDITVTVTQTAKEAKVTIDGTESGLTYTMDDAAFTSNSTDVATGSHTFKFTATDGYNYTYKVGSGDAQAVTVSGTNASFTVDLDMSNAVTIAVDKAAVTYTVTSSTGTGYTVTAPSPATYNQAYSFVVKPDAGYTPTVTVTVGGTKITTPTPTGNTYTIAAGSVTGDIVISVTAEEAKYDLEFSGLASGAILVDSSNAAITNKTYTGVLTASNTYTFTVGDLGANTKITITNAKVKDSNNTDLTSGTSTLTNGETYTVYDATGNVTLAFST